MNIQLEPSWKTALATEFSKDYFTQLTNNVRHAYLKEGLVYPPPKLVFNAFTHCPLKRVQVVILGQDPYHGPGQAHGLSFSVPEGIAIPPSLRNIYQEIASDIGTTPPANGNLERWADQGVLLLNSTLTVRAGAAGSHQSFGWEEFTDAVIATISRERKNVVFLLWGAFAGGKAALIDAEKHLVLKAPHPSPLSAHRGFFGCKHFSQCNAYLEKHGQAPISW
jgi:uracil-DNA glycosylase